MTLIDVYKLMQAGYGPAHVVVPLALQPPGVGVAGLVISAGLVVLGTPATDLNNEIKAGIPNNPKVKAMDPPALGAADIQDTALGGCPHPNVRGHQKIADKLKTTYDGM